LREINAKKFILTEREEMSLIDLIKRRKNVVNEEGKGIDLAVYIIKKFENRRFDFKGLRKKYYGLSADSLLKRLREEMDSMLMLYSYTTKMKRFTDKNGIAQVRISMIGSASAMNRYNIFDVELKIKSE